MNYPILGGPLDGGNRPREALFPWAKTMLRPLLGGPLDGDERALRYYDNTTQRLLNGE